jgi:endo-1,4-beta-xylanase
MVVKNNVRTLLVAVLGGFIAAGAFAGGTKEAAPAAKVVYENGFEADTGSWTGRGGNETLTLAADAHSGKQALAVAGRTASWNGPQLLINGLVTPGSEYAISLWARLISPASAKLTLSTQVGEGGAAAYNNLQGKTVAANDGWVVLEGTYRYTSGGFASIYVESDNAAATYAIDDVTIKEVPAVPMIVEKIKPLKDVYAKYFRVGNVVSAPSLEGVRWELLSRHFNILTAENAMKPDALQREKGVFTFDAADAMVDQALVAGIKIHGHTLAWHQQSPDWMNRPGINRDDAIANLETHAKTVAAHFAGRVVSWDVLNEAIVDNPANPTDWRASLRDTNWLKAIGPEYIPIVFTAARVADPAAKLYYNDYNLDNADKALAVYTMVKELNAAYPNVGGRPLIDGVGMQGHYRVNTSPANVEASLKRFVDLGVEVSITELDVQAGADGKLTAAQAEQQGVAYARLFTIFKKYAKSISRVTVWGLDDGASWRSATNPVLFGKNLRAKEAVTALLAPEAYVKKHPNAFAAKAVKQGEAVYGTPTLDGTAEALWDRAPELSVNQYLAAWQGASGNAKVLWDEHNLYVLVTVTNAQLNKANAEAYQHDSVEVFVDEDNAKTPYYEGDDGQYRVNFANEASFNPRSAASGFESSTTVTGTSSYTVEAKIPLRTITAKPGTLIGFDAQINGASSARIRESVAVWSDITGSGFQDTSGFGVLKLVK